MLSSLVLSVIGQSFCTVYNSAEKCSHPDFIQFRTQSVRQQLFMQYAPGTDIQEQLQVCFVKASSGDAVLSTSTVYC